MVKYILLFLLLPSLCLAQVSQSFTPFEKSGNEISFYVTTTTTSKERLNLDTIDAKIKKLEMAIAQAETELAWHKKTREQAVQLGLLTAKEVQQKQIEKHEKIKKEYKLKKEKGTK